MKIGPLLSKLYKIKVVDAAGVLACCLQSSDNDRLRGVEMAITALFSVTRAQMPVC